MNSETVEYIKKPAEDFIRESWRLLKRCTKPDRTGARGARGMLRLSAARIADADASGGSPGRCRTDALALRRRRRAAAAHAWRRHRSCDLLC